MHIRSSPAKIRMPTILICIFAAKLNQCSAMSGIAVPLDRRASLCANPGTVMGNQAESFRPPYTVDRPLALALDAGESTLAGCGKTPQGVIPSGARNLALSVFQAMRDSSSPAAPRSDSPPGFFRSLPGWNRLRGLSWGTWEGSANFRYLSGTCRAWPCPPCCFHGSFSLPHQHSKPQRRIVLICAPFKVWWSMRTRVNP